MEVTSEARDALAPGEALVFDWHRVAICCAVAGEVSLRRTSMHEVERSGSLIATPSEREEMARAGNGNGFRPEGREPVEAGGR